MNVVSMSKRLSNIGNKVFNIRFSSVERPLLRKSKNYDLVGNKYQVKKENDERIDGMGWLLLSIPIGTFMLGTWQVKRRKWKLQLIEDLNKKMTAPPIALPENLQEIQEMEYLPVKVKGEYLYDKEFRIGPKSLIKDGVPVGEKSGGLLSTTSSTGYWIITPFKLEDRNLIILINRGWVKARRGKIPEDELAHVPGIVEITGVVRLNEKRPVFMARNSPQTGLWTYRDINSMARFANSAPIFLDLIAGNDSTNGPIAGQTRMSLRNEHLTYIITWYGLSFLTACMWYRMYIKKLPLL